MSLSIQTNVSSLLALDHLRVNTDFQQRTIERLSSGYRINSSGDDAAGLAVANSYRSSVAELNQGVRNANDGVSTLQIVDGGLSNITKMLDRLKTLATQGASDTFTGDPATLQGEMDKIVTEITRQANNIGLDTAGTNLKSLSVYIGGSTATVSLDLSGQAVDATGLSIGALKVDTTAHATAAIQSITDALALVGGVQGAVGAGQNELGYAINLATSQVSSYSAAESRVRDADIASEAANLTKAQVLQQSSMAALAQANSAPQSVLTLFK